MPNNGLNFEDMKQVSELLTKANLYQLFFIINSTNNEIMKRNHNPK